MSDIREILKQNLEDYEALEKQARGYEAQNKKLFAIRHKYAGFFDKPVRQGKILFLLGEKGEARELPKQMLEYIVSNYENQYNCICLAGEEVSLPENVKRVEDQKAPFLKALATAGIIVTGRELPLYYVKREGQRVFHLMSGMYGRDGMQDQETVSHAARDLLKSDDIYAPSLEEARKTWLEQSEVGRFFQGNVLTCRNAEKAAKTLTRAILGKDRGFLKGFGRAKQTQLYSSNKKRMLILTDWSANREVRLKIRQFVKSVDTKIWDVAILSSWFSDQNLYQEFMALPKDAVKLIYRGRMVQTEEGLFDFRMMEKSPDLCKTDEQLHAHMAELMEQEWRWMLGWQKWDTCVLAGASGYLGYHLAVNAHASNKVLVDINCLPYLREKKTEVWEQAVKVFDEIKKVPLLPAEKPGEEEGQTLIYEGKEYLLCDRWREPRVLQEQIRLELLPDKDSCLVNAELPLTEERKQLLIRMKKDHRVYLMGAFAESYRHVCENSVVLDEYVQNTLYLLPAAWKFFGRFSCYLGDPSIKQDFLREICEAYGVKCVQ